MLTLYNSSKPVEALKSFNIVPLSISYEFDPCDYLKAKSISLKGIIRYKKSQADDIENMRTGITGYKGKVFFRLGKQINDELSEISSDVNRTKFWNLLPKLSTQKFTKIMCFPINYLACDLMENNNAFADKYTDKDKAFFDNYIDGQIAKIDILTKTTIFAPKTD